MAVSEAQTASPHQLTVLRLALPLEAIRLDQVVQDLPVAEVTNTI